MQGREVFVFALLVSSTDPNIKDMQFVAIVRRPDQADLLTKHSIRTAPLNGLDDVVVAQLRRLAIRTRHCAALCRWHAYGIRGSTHPGIG